MLTPKLDRIEGHTFLPGLLGADAVVVDLGANTGRFSAKMIAKYGCRSYAAEPSPQIWRQIPEMVGLHKFNVAISGKDGPLHFNISDNSECSSQYSKNYGKSIEQIEVEGVRISTFLKRIGVTAIDMLKIDIEGSEFDVLADLSPALLKNVKQMSVEFHVGVGEYE